MFFGTLIFQPFFPKPLPFNPDDCPAPCQTQVLEKASIQITGTLLDYQTASIGITSLSGENRREHNYFLALWPGFRVGKIEDTLKTQTIEKNELSMVLFDGLNINSQFNYTIGLGLIADNDTTMQINICATLTIPPGICPPRRLRPTESGVCISARYAQSIIIDFWTPNYANSKQRNQWMAVYTGAITPKLFTTDQLIGSQFLTDQENNGTLIMKNLNLKRMTTYSVVYGIGKQNDSIPNYNVGIAATSFKTN